MVPIRISQLETAIHFLAPVMLDYSVNGREWIRSGNRCPQAAPHGVYPCQGEDRWCAIAVYDDREWQAFCHTIGHAEWVHDPRFYALTSRKQNEDELDELIDLWTKEHRAEEVMGLLQGAGVACGVVKTGQDIHEDPQLRHRNNFQMLNHPEIGLHSYDTQSFQLSETPASLERPGPCLSEHTELICKEFLGMTDDEFIALFNEGVFE
jgi:benzylsuccinate CoA-transferase BbsF subunit